MKEYVAFKLKGYTLLMLIAGKIQKINYIKLILKENDKILTNICNTHLYLYYERKVYIHLKVNDAGL